VALPLPQLPDMGSTRSKGQGHSLAEDRYGDLLSHRVGAQKRTLVNREPFGPPVGPPGDRLANASGGSFISGDNPRIKSGVLPIIFLYFSRFQVSKSQGREILPNNYITAESTYPQTKNFSDPFK